MPKIALIVLERPWGERVSPNNRASVLPFFQGLQQLKGEFDLYHSHFYNKTSFELALDEMLQGDYDDYYVYVACHGYGRKLENMHLTSALKCINEHANRKNIVGVIIGACLVGENSHTFQAFTETSSIVWKFGYKCSVSWLKGTILDLQIFSELLNLDSLDLYSREDIVEHFRKALSEYRPDASIGWTKKDDEMEIQESLTLVVQPKGKGYHAKDCSDELF